MTKSLNSCDAQSHVAEPTAHYAQSLYKTWTSWQRKLARYVWFKVEMTSRMKDYQEIERFDHEESSGNDVIVMN